MNHDIYNKLLEIVNYCRNNLISERQNEILTLFYEFNLSKEDIAIELSISQEEVEESLGYIGNILKEYIGNQISL